MEIFGSNFLVGLSSILDTLLTIYFWIVFIAVAITWVNPNPYNPIIRILRGLTEPVLYRARKWLPFLRAGGFDFSPIAVLVAIQLVRYVVVKSLAEFGMGIR